MRVNNGLTPQELEAYGISDVHDIVYNQATICCIRKSWTRA